MSLYALDLERLNQYKAMGDPLSNDNYIEWTKDIFKDSKGPRKLLVMSVETAQYFIDRGVPSEYIEVLKPLPRKRKCYRKPK